MRDSSQRFQRLPLPPPLRFSSVGFITDFRWERWEWDGVKVLENPDQKILWNARREGGGGGGGGGRRWNPEDPGRKYFGTISIL